MDYPPAQERAARPLDAGIRFIVNPTDMEEHYAKAEREEQRRLTLEQEEREKRPKFNPETMLGEEKSKNRFYGLFEDNNEDGHDDEDENED